MACERMRRRTRPFPVSIGRLADFELCVSQAPGVLVAQCLLNIEQKPRPFGSPAHAASGESDSVAERVCAWLASLVLAAISLYPSVIGMGFLHMPTTLYSQSRFCYRSEVSYMARGSGLSEQFGGGFCEIRQMKSAPARRIDVRVSIMARS